MICLACREDKHGDCEGTRRHRTYCDCQHRPGFIAAIRRQAAQVRASLRAHWGEGGSSRG